MLLLSASAGVCARSQARARSREARLTRGLDDPLAVRLGRVALASAEGDTLNHGEELLVGRAGQCARRQASGRRRGRVEAREGFSSRAGARAGRRGRAGRGKAVSWAALSCLCNARYALGGRRGTERKATLARDFALAVDGGPALAASVHRLLALVRLALCYYMLLGACTSCVPACLVSLRSLHLLLLVPCSPAWLLSNSKRPPGGSTDLHHAQSLVTAPSHAQLEQPRLPQRLVRPLVHRRAVPDLPVRVVMAERMRRRVAGLLLDLLDQSRRVGTLLVDFWWLQDLKRVQVGRRSLEIRTRVLRIATVGCTAD